MMQVSVSKGWASAKLRDVADLERDSIQPADIATGTTYVGLEHIVSDGTFLNVASVDEGELASSKFSFSPDHLLYGKLRPYLRKIIRPDFHGVCSTDILPLKPSARINKDYLFHYLRQPSMVELATSRCSGANLPRLSPQTLLDFPIIFPPLPEQKRIAAILDKADSIRHKRQEAVRLTEELLRSVFLDMFGDPVTNPKGWPKSKLSEVVLGKYGIKAGPFGSSLKKEDYTTSGYRIYGQEQVIAGRFDIGDYYIGERKFQQLKGCEVAEGDLLVSLVGSFGKVLVVPSGIEPGIINPRLLKITPNRDLATPIFLAAVLGNPSIQEEFGRMAHGGTMGILNVGLLKQLDVILPAVKVQQEFASRLEVLKKLEVSLQFSSSGSVTLFDSLLQRAFKGLL